MVYIYASQFLYVCVCVCVPNSTSRKRQPLESLGIGHPVKVSLSPNGIVARCVLCLHILYSISENALKLSESCCVLGSRAYFGVYIYIYLIRSSKPKIRIAWQCIPQGDAECTYREWRHMMESAMAHKMSLRAECNRN